MQQKASGLTAVQREIVAAAAERILPSDDGPGAAETRVIDFIEGRLKEASSQRRCERFTRAADLLQDLSRQLHGRPFPECSAAEKDSVLQAFEGIPHPTLQRFFSELISMTLSGFLCPPGYGGNYDRLGWRYLGLNPQSAAPISRRRPGGGR